MSIIVICLKYLNTQRKSYKIVNKILSTNFLFNCRPIYQFYYQIQFNIQAID